eukprot:UN17084
MSRRQPAKASFFISGKPCSGRPVWSHRSLLPGFQLDKRPPYKISANQEHL